MSIKQGGILIAGGGNGGGVATNIDNITITNNAQQEIQTEAKVNRNTATGSETYLYDWVGTFQQYQNQNIETTHPEWICYITDDSAGSVINNSTITFTQGGVTKGQITLNQANDQTIAFDAGGGGSVTDIEWATYGTTTFQDIQSWYNASKLVCIKYNGMVFSFSYIYGNEIVFYGCSGNSLSKITVDSTNMWAYYTDTGNVTWGKIIGTLTDQSDLSLALAGKVNTGHEVIEWQAPTSANSYKWYRKYADGWVEQGQFSISTPATITLQVTMDSTNYQVTATPLGTNLNQGIHATVISATQIAIGNDDDWNMCWEVKGMYAQS